jgi:riboflavin transporter FmnP
MLPQLPTTPQMEGAASKAAADGNQDWQSSRYLPNIARVLAVISNLTIVLSIVGIGYWHFDNVKTGIGCAVMYLLLPYTAQMTGNLEHVIPAALMVLALLTYRQPVVSGLMFGLAAGLVYYPMFLLPLWLSFYWKRGLGRYLVGFSVALVLLVSLLLLQGWEEFLTHISRMFGLWLPRLEGLEGIWGPNRVQADYRLPVLVGCMLLSGSYAIWPSRKSLATLISGTAVVMLATQFWHGYGGGLYMAWFLPFVLLTVFRPNLDDRIATTVVRPLRPTAVT